MDVKNNINMEALIPFVLGGIILWLYMRGLKKVNKSAPNCCGKPMKRTGGGSYGGKYGRGGHFWKCRECGCDYITYD